MFVGKAGSHTSQAPFKCSTLLKNVLILENQMTDLKTIIRMNDQQGPML